MKMKRIVLFTFLFIGITTTSNAQFWKKIQKKLEKKVEQKVEEKIDKESDKAIDDALNGKPKKEEETKTSKTNQNKTKRYKEIPKFTGGNCVLTLTDNGIRYQAEDVNFSIYGKFTENNLSNAVKTYNEDKLTRPVDTYPPNYAVAYNEGGFFNPKAGQIIIHHADATKIVYSLKGDWSIKGKLKPIEASFVSLNVSKIINLNETDEPVNHRETSSANLDDIFDNQENADPEIPDTFSFTSSLKVQISTNGEKSVELDFLIGKYSNIYGMAIQSEDMGEGNEVYNVVTPETVTMFMNVGGMKIKKSASQKQYSKADFSERMPANSGDLKKTGATKSILGFTCHEYKYTQDADYTSIWVTKDFPYQETYISMLGMAENNGLEGFVLEMNMKYGNDTSIMKAVEFNKNKNFTINTNDYKSLGF